MAVTQTEFRQTSVFAWCPTCDFQVTAEHDGREMEWAREHVEETGHRVTFWEERECSLTKSASTSLPTE
jgi:hypothetical protein